MLQSRNTICRLSLEPKRYCCRFKRENFSANTVARKCVCNKYTIRSLVTLLIIRCHYDMRVSVNSMFGCAPSILSENGWSRLFCYPWMESFLVKLDRLGTDLKVRIRRLSNRYPTKTYEWVPYSTNVTSAVAWGSKKCLGFFADVACGAWNLKNLSTWQDSVSEGFSGASQDSAKQWCET